MAPGGFAEGRLDLGRVGVAGHSRGAKLAALHFVGAPYRFVTHAFQRPCAHPQAILCFLSQWNLQSVFGILQNDQGGLRQRGRQDAVTRAQELCRLSL